MSFFTDTFVYYPISFILWVWYRLFTFIADLIPGVTDAASSGIIWALSVIFLVVTLRIILYWPAAKQIRFSRKMQAVQPQMKALQKRYKNDRQKLAEETRKLQKKEGFNPLLGCLPMLIQIPVFLGLFHVLRSFNRMGSMLGQLGMSAEETRSHGNYMFNADEVRAFLDARLFGTPLSSFIGQAEDQFAAYAPIGSPVDFERWNIWVVAVPLMIVSAVAIHLNARLTISKQTPEAAANPQSKIMNQLMLWAFPIGILVTGAFWPLAILLYMVVNNVWTFGQQHYLYGKMDLEEEAARAERHEARAALAPKPGAKPVNPKKGGKRAPSAPAASTPTSGAEDVTTEAESAPSSVATVEEDRPERRKTGFFSAVSTSIRKRGVARGETASAEPESPDATAAAEPVADEAPTSTGSTESAGASSGKAKAPSGPSSAPKPGQRPQGQGKKKKKKKKK